jgi:hypothetical protein
MIDKVNVQVIWDKGAYNKITQEVPDKIVFETARETLDLVFPIMPELTGKMKRSSLAKGVQGSNKNYKIGSYTDYASFVYVKDNNKTHWTTPGTQSYWFSDYWQKHGKSIFNSVVERNILK